MQNLEQQQREKVVEVAKSYLRTPYRHMGRVKGQGVDCLTLLAEVFTDAGLINRPEIEFYPQDFMHHRDVERYVEGLLQYAEEVEGEPQPGDIVLWKFGRVFSHAAIVVKWPQIIHAKIGECVSLDDAEASTWLGFVGEPINGQGKPRPRKCFSFWAKNKG